MTGELGGWNFSLVGVVLVLLTAAGHADAVAMVTGNVFCDQCRDGHLTFFDLPVSGAKVALECGGQTATTATTDLLGNFMMKLDGTPDLSACSVRVTESPSTSDCNIVGSPPRALSLTFSLFNMEFYSVSSLFFYPAKTMSLCGNTHKDPPPAPTGAIISPPPSPPLGGIISLPPPPPPPFGGIIPLPPPPPPVGIVSPPRSGGIISLPPLPFFEASACSYDIWVKAEYMCHWKFVEPQTKVSFVFGEEAAKRYGHNMNLWRGLNGRGDVYRTLLREATAALLNSYNTLNFGYNSVSVIMHMHWALHSPSPQYALRQAMSFKKANLGLVGGVFGGKGNAKCLLTPCKKSSVP